MGLVGYTLFIYDEVKEEEDSEKYDYIKQVIDYKNWAPISDEIYLNIGDTEWFDDLISIDKNVGQSHFLIKKLIITEKHEIGVIRFDVDVINYFNEFDKQLKNMRTPNDMLVYISDNGGVYVIKNI